MQVVQEQPVARLTSPHAAATSATALLYAAVPLFEKIRMLSGIIVVVA